MIEGIEDLTEKEKQTLRLVVRGYDAKAMARHFDLSVHTINERLRHARRKLSVSSSREAARLLYEQESRDPDSVGYKEMGDAAVPPYRQSAGPEATKSNVVRIVGGLVSMIAIIAAILLSSANPNGLSGSANLAPQPTTAPEELAASPAVRSALAWLALVDGGNWAASYRDTGQQFKELNTEARWTEVSRQVRPPMGAVISRTAESQEMVPAPPSGYQMVKFRTRFADKGEILETLTLVNEGGRWKVVGYILG